MINRMVWNQTAYFGPGAITAIPNELRRRSFTKAFVVTDPVLIETGVAQKVLSLLDDEAFPYVVFSDIKPNPPIENVLAGLAAFDEAKADVLIAIGGGSPQDTCKAIGIIANNREFSDVRSLEGTAATTNPSVPIIAIPTTAGTASETTINYVITDTENKRKFVCVDPHDIPILAIVDPEMMASAPRGLKVSTGLDALTHAIEGYITAGAFDLSDMFHIKAIQMIATALPSAADGDPEAADQMAMAQYIAGMGYSNVGLGLVHGMSHPLGAFFNAPHGLANGILLAAVLEYNAPNSGEKYRAIGEAFGVDGARTLPIEEVREQTVAAIRDFAIKLGNPTSISAIGATEADIPSLAEAAYADVCTGGNPRKTNPEEIAAIYRSLL
ncbi:lactaldehyde reductase [Changpingibacter yushuensis]|uniref:lactaldehyde reductase n=1 Tax=Changpingibacter yushuensis TaxID=2758440 RepID=UPI0015F4BA07|nr:lactaldehyde reductase [Changpingibacter yushuensis]